jgi:phospholipid-binding lipoprotein MlaA
MKNFREYRGAAAALVLAIAISGTTALADEEKAKGTSDLLEMLNRFTSGFNTILRKGFIDPAFDLYQYVTPDPIENAISNAASNLSEPLTVGSSLLQGDTENAGKSTQRFLINTTVGIGGLGDPATDMGIEARRDRRKGRGRIFGQTGNGPIDQQGRSRPLCRRARSL